MINIALLATRAQWPYGLKNHSLHYWGAPRGPRGVKKSHFLQIKLLSSFAKIDPKWQKLQKAFKIGNKIVKNHVFLHFFKYSSISAQY